MPKAEIPSEYEGHPVLTAERARELDRQASERFGIAAETLMESAGAAVARETLAYLQQTADKAPQACAIVVCCGRGANGGDGLVAARRLAGAGASVKVFLAPAKKDSSYPELVTKNLERAKEAGVTVDGFVGDGSLEKALQSCDAVLDALLGTGSAGKPAGPIHAMIQRMTRSKKPVVAVDLPSGLHPDTGYHSGVFVTAALTLTLGWPKRGLLAAHAQKYVGRLMVLDIGYPAALK